MLYINYHKFVQGVKLRSLCKIPDDLIPKKEPEIKKVEEKRPEDKKTEEKKEAAPEEKKVKAYDTDVVNPYKIRLHPDSQDDFPQVWHLLNFQRSIQALNEEAKSAGSILVCLLEQIGSNKDEKPQPKLTVNQELAAIFQHSKELISGEIKPKIIKEEKKEIAEVPSKKPEESVYDFQDIVKSFYHSEKLINGTTSACEVELGILANFMYPGKNRNMMPVIPEKPKSVRKAITSEMHPFSSLPIYEFERAMIITEFEKMFSKANPQTTWKFGDRIYEEMYSSTRFAELFSNYILFSPDILTSYYVLNDSLLVGLYYQTPPGRTLYKQWKSRFLHLPDFPNFRTVFGGQPLPHEILDIDDNKVGQVEDKQKFLYPGDNSVIQIGHKKISGDDLTSVYVLKDNYMFGLRSISKENSEFWLRFENGTRLEVHMQNKKNSEIKNAVATLTLACGLIVKLTGEGDIVQTSSEAICDCKTEEKHRVITGKGTVCSYLSNGNIDIMMANGCTSEYKNGTWIGTNSQGKRRSRKDNEIELEPIKCATVTDSVSLARVTLRQDGVLSVRYKDGRLLTKHKDETSILTSPDGQNIIVEKMGFAPIKVRVELNAPPKTINKGAEGNLIGFEDVMKRAYDSKVSVTYLPDGTNVESFMEKREAEIQSVHLIRRTDGGIVEVRGNGEVVIITPQERVNLNNSGQKKEIGKDVDYFSELFAEEMERKCGVYTARCDLGTIFTKDNEGNIFQVLQMDHPKKK